MIDSILSFILAFHKAIEVPKVKQQCAAIGTVSYYDDWYNGRQTANGDIFNQNEYTMAVADELPFGRYKLTNLNNGKFVFVVANDRGAFAPRVADLSKVAFSTLGNLDDGLISDICLEKVEE